MAHASQHQELPVTFHPALYLQRRGWVLDIMRREGATEVLDIGCGEGELLACLCNPAPWLAPPPQDVLRVSPSPAVKSESETARPHCEPDDDTYTTVLAELHRDILHPKKISGLDICRADLDCTVRTTKPPPPEVDEETKSPWHRAPARWEELEVNIWEGGLEHVNPAFVGVECIVATEVIEHLPGPILARFAPVVMGAYHPRLLLLTTPSYTFNARFTAPDAPSSARSGWRDPSGRTERIFRHHDHKFEWTVEEFQHWCMSVAEKWGYEVLEIGGVGRAAERDEWGRDDELGWASQVVAFKRRDGDVWGARRERRWQEMEDLHRNTPVGTAETHQLLATHHHPAQESSGRPQPLDMVGELIIAKMVHFHETAISLTEMWFEPEVERNCGGLVDWLVQAIKAHEGLALQKTSFGSSAIAEWTIQLESALHHLIPPESHVDAWATPPDTDEVEDPRDPFDDDDMLWAQHGEGALAKRAGDEANEGTLYDGWGTPDEVDGHNVDWSAPNSGGWGKVADLSETDAGNWGAPEGGWTWGNDDANNCTQR